MDSFFPLREGLTRHYCLATTVLVEQFDIRVGPQVEIDVTDMVGGGDHTVRAWTLEQGSTRPRFAVEQTDGVQIFERRTFGEPAREALVMTVDWRWKGEPAWSHPTWHYSLGKMSYRRAGEEDITVTAGAYRCIKILLDDGDSGAVWLAQGVGLIRSVGRIEGLNPARYSVIELLGLS